MFKKEFKYYKSRCPPPEYDDVIDFHQLNARSIEKVRPRLVCQTKRFENFLKYGLSDLNQWKMYEFKEKPGLIFILNPFTKEGQHYWVEKCLKEYTRKPNRLNLDPFNNLHPDEDWWQVSQNDKKRGPNLLIKLRWATLGYHHNWDTKEYSEDAYNAFPPELADLSWLIVQAVGDPARDTYRSEAAIVNFYHLDSTLSGHRDVSEPNMTSPLVSISFGQSAIFLVGGPTLEESVTAMMLHSGDIVIMSEATRSSYHGVPRILPAPDRSWADGHWEATACGRYLESSRININVRQVLLPGQQMLINR